MKPLIAIFCLVAAFTAGAQGKMAPIPSVIIIYGTNASARVTVLHTSSQGFKEDYDKQRSVVTNLALTCMSVNSVAIKGEQKDVRLVLHGVVVYGPQVVAGSYGKDQKLQEMRCGVTAIDLLPEEEVQVNGEILSAHSLAGKYQTIPDAKKQD